MWRQNQKPASDELSPARALLHPAWILALAVLVVNDHLLKDLYPGLVTGKLSDVAGLLVAPTLLAALTGVRRRRELWLCAGAVSAVFAAINLSPGAAHVWDELMRTVAFGWVTTSSWTDLLALPAVPLGIWMLRPTMQTAPDGPRRRRAAMALAIVGGLACAATSPPTPEPPARGNQTFRARVALQNRTHELQAFRIRQLRNDVQLDCDVVGQAPQHYLTDAMFGEPTRWELFSDQKIGLDTGTNRGGNPESMDANDCDAAYVAIETAPDIVVFWTGELEVQRFEHNPAGPPEESGKAPAVNLIGDYFQVPEDQMNPYRAQPCEDNIPCGQNGRRQLAEIPEGANYAWHSQAERRLHFQWPDRNEQDRMEVPRSCQPRGPGEGLAWEQLPRGQKRMVHGFEAGEDGCHTLKLGPVTEDRVTVQPRLVCAPEAALAPLKPTGNSKAVIEAMPVAELPSTGERYAGLRIDVERGQTNGVIWLSRGTTIPGVEDTSLEAELRAGCGPVPANCGQVEVASDLRVGGQDLAFSPGESLEFKDGGRRKRVHLVRSVYRPAVRPMSTCENGGAVIQALGGRPGHYIEAATVVGLDAVK